MLIEEFIKAEMLYLVFLKDNLTSIINVDFLTTS